MLFKFVERKWLYFAFSLAIILPGLFFLLIGGLKLGVEFRGGTLLDAQFRETPPAATEVHDLFARINHPEVIVQGAEGNRLLIRAAEMQPEDVATAQRALATQYPTFSGVSSSVVSASFSAELIQNAIAAITVASVFIVLLIAFAFRSFGWAAFRYGIAAIVSLLHDAALVLGMFAILGYFFHVEVDSLFVTAVLTIIGFSVHDTIVVFDRIRENLRLNPGEALNAVINYSIMQTLARSVITSLTVCLTLLSLYFFGGYSVRNFALALLIGIVSGTYSSIFNASQIISLWQEVEDRLKRRGASAVA